MNRTNITFAPKRVVSKKIMKQDQEQGVVEPTIIEIKEEDLQERLKKYIP